MQHHPTRLRTVARAGFESVAVESKRQMTFVVPVKKGSEILQKNLLLSPCLRDPRHQLIVQENFPSAPRAYNDAIERSVNDLIVFCHDDVFLPELWVSQLNHALDYLQAKDPHWGVLGCAGRTRDNLSWGHLYSSGLGVLGAPFDQPQTVQTLDEVVLIMRKSSGLRFDNNLSHFHLYGADICLQATKARMKNYAISAFCIHNTRQIIALPKEFYECCRYIKRVWKEDLPIQTTCIRITRFNLPLYLTRVRELYERHRRGGNYGLPRSEDVYRIVAECDSDTAISIAKTSSARN